MFYFQLDQADLLSSSSASASGPISIGGGGGRGDSGEDLLFELAVKGFQAELDLDDPSVIRDRRVVKY